MSVSSPGILPRSFLSTHTARARCPCQSLPPCTPVVTVVLFADTCPNYHHHLMTLSCTHPPLQADGDNRPLLDWHWHYRVCPDQSSSIPSSPWPGDPRKYTPGLFFAGAVWGVSNVSNVLPPKPVISANRSALPLAHRRFASLSRAAARHFCSPL